MSATGATGASGAARRRGVILGVSGEESLGWAIAARLAAQGARLALTCRPGRLAEVAPLAARLEASVHAVDIDDEASLAAAFAALGAGDAPLDFLVHTWVSVPGALLAGPLTDVGRADFEGVLARSAWSLVAACRHAAPLLARSVAPRVVALTSGCSHRMTPGYHVAGIAKAALEAAVLYLAMQLGPRGVLVNAVSCSLVATGGAVRAVGAKNAAATRAVQARRAATGRAVEPDEVARAVAFLCGAEAQNLTGEILTVDGGFGRAYL
jgi:enoyl-[acyl-carrier protein] reductase I